MKPVLQVRYFRDKDEGWIASFVRPIKGLRTTHFYHITPASKRRLNALNIPWSDSSLGKKFYTPAAALFEQNVELSGHLEDMIRSNERLRAENTALRAKIEALKSVEFVTDDLSMYCPWCSANDLGHAGTVTHTSDCPRDTP